MLAGTRSAASIRWGSSCDDCFHTDIAHKQLFFDDGLIPSNVGFFNDPSGAVLQSGEV
jgi:hypothetical protein